MESDLFLKLIATILAAMAGIGGIIVFTIKTIIGNQISKDLEKFKVRFSRLHEEQAGVIRDLYGAIVEIEDDIVNLLYKYRPIGLDPPDIEEIDVIRRMRNLQLLFSKSRIYLDDQTCAAVQRVCDHLSSALGPLEQRRMFLESGSDDQSDMSYELEGHVFDELQAQIPDAKTALEREFRRLLGAA